MTPMHSQSASALIHESYQDSVRKSKTTLELLQNFYSSLQKNRARVRKDEEERLSKFIESIHIDDDDNKG